MERDTPVFAGTTNVSSPVQIEVRASGEATRVGKLMRLVTECARQKAPIVLFADRIAGRFLVSVLAISVMTFVLWWILGSPAAVDHAVAILIVTCPCALGLATPLAVSVAIGRAAGRGILIKGGPTLERLAVNRALLLLDKTGTITTGRPTLVRCVGDDSAMAAVAAIESHSTHPIARALVAALPESTAVANRVVQHRQGITAAVEGWEMAIGSPAFVMEQAQSKPEWLERELVAGLEHALTPILVAVDGKIVAACFVGDQVRADVAGTLQALRGRGWEIGILSGDHPAVVS